jgi:transposase-like protein
MGKKWGRTGAIYEAHMEEIARDFEGGAELKEIATKYGVSPPTITNWLIKAGYKHRRKGRYPQAMKERAATLYEAGWEPIAIANLFKTKLDYVHDWIGESRIRLVSAPRTTAPMEPAYKRHATGRRWTEAQKEEVIRLLSAGIFSVDQIYRLTNASRVRQQRLWKQFVGSPFPLPKERRPRPERPEPEAITTPEAFQQGRLEGLKEARQLALEAGDDSQVQALVPLEARVREASDAEIEEDFRRFEELKRMLDEGQEPPPS